jgi:hypothetical protein
VIRHWPEFAFDVLKNARISLLALREQTLQMASAERLRNNLERFSPLEGALTSTGVAWQRFTVPAIEMGSPEWGRRLSSSYLEHLFRFAAFECNTTALEEEELYRKRTRKAVLRFLKRFWCLFTKGQTSEMEQTDVECNLSQAKRLLKAILQILELQLCIQYLLNTLLVRINSECVQPRILASRWVKVHGPRPPRLLGKSGSRAVLWSV